MRKRDGHFVNFCTLTPFSQGHAELSLQAMRSMAWQCIADGVNELLRPIPLPISLRLDQIFKNDEQEN
jgi:hypothetical protein